MIDFRYHLISIVAVLLALAIGIFAGSGFLGGPLLKDLRGRLNNLEEINKERRQANSGLRAELRDSEEFAEGLEPLVIGDALLSDRVVIFVLEGTDPDMIEGLQSEIEQAGGTVPSVITFTNKFALQQTADSDQLALIVHSAGAKPADVRKDAAQQIGSTAATAGAFAGGEPRGASAAVARWHALLDQLERAGFVTVDQIDGEEPVPPGSDFLVAGGTTDPAPYSVAPFVIQLAQTIASSENAVVVTEPADSVWGVNASIRDDSNAAAIVATAEAGDTLEGEISVVLGLAAAKRGEVGHYGRGPGSTALVPSPAPGA